MADVNELSFRLRLSAKDLENDVKRAKGNLGDLQSSLERALGATAPGRGRKASAELKAVREELQKTLTDVKKLKAEGVININDALQVSPLKRATLLGRVDKIAAGIKGATPEAIEAKELKIAIAARREKIAAEREEAKALSVLEQQLQKQIYDMQILNQHHVDFAGNAITLRYALYDVSAVMGNISRATLGFANAMLQAGIAQEKSFTQVEKTLGGSSSKAIEDLRNQLIDLSTQIPLTFDEISKIAMLGSQLGVAESQLADFTDTVAKFSALTGMTAEEAAMGFGKIANVLKLVDKEGKVSGESMVYLGSAIAAVGFESAATETQIISTARQIGAVATAAGLSASQVIGLSSAMASIGIAPEEARGVVVQLFNQMNQAASSFIESTGRGSDRLQTFASVAAMSAEEFARGWGDKRGGASQVFSAFIENLGSGYDVTQVLRQIGLDGVRTSKGLTALSASFAAMANQIKIAQQAGLSGTFLDDSAAKIIDDIDSRIKMLQSSIQALYASALESGPVKETFGVILDILNNFINGVRKIDQATGGTFSGILVSVTALVGGLTLLISTAAIVGGSMLAFRTAIASAAQAGVLFNGTLMQGLLALAGFNKEQIAGVIATQADIAAKRADTVATQGLTTATVGATAATRGLSIAMRVLGAATGIGLVAAIIATVVEAMGAIPDAADKADAGLEGFQKSAIETAKALEMTRSEFKDFLDAVLDIPNAKRGFENALFAMGQAAQQAGAEIRNGSAQSTQGLRGFEGSVESVLQSAIEFYGASSGDLKQFFLSYQAFLKANGMLTAGAAQQIEIALSGLQDVVANDSLVINFGAALEGLGTSAGGAASQVKTLSEVVDEALKKLNSKFDLYDSLRNLGSSLQQAGKGFNSLTQSGSENFDALNQAISTIVSNAGKNSQLAANQLGSLRKALWQSGVTAKGAFLLIDTAIAATGKKSKTSATDIARFFQQITSGIESSVERSTRTIRDWADEIGTVLNDAFDIRFEQVQGLESIASAWMDIEEASASAAKSLASANDELSTLTADRAVLEYRLATAIKYGDTLRANKLRAELAALNGQIVDKQQEIADAQDAASKSLTGNSKAAINNRSKLRDLVKGYQEYLKTVAATTTDQGQLSDAADEARKQFLDQAKALGFAESELSTYADAIGIDFKTAIKNLPTDITLNLAGTDPIISAIASFVAKANGELDKIKVIDLSGNSLEFSNGSNKGSAAPIGGNAPSSNVPTGPGVGGTGNGGSATAGGQLAPAPTPTTPTAANTKGIYRNLTGTSDSVFGVLAGDLASLVNGKGLTVKSKLELIGSRSGKPAPSVDQINAFRNLTSQYMSEMKAWEKKSIVERLRDGYAHNTLISELGKNIFGFNNRFGFGYSTGGYVAGPGTSTSDSIPARLSNGEFVMSAKAVSTYGVDFMNALNQMRPTAQRLAGGSSSAAGGSNMVYLSPEDRALLRAVVDRPIALYTENTKIAQSANAGNVILAQRGSN